MVIKIHYGTLKLQKVTYDVIKITSPKFCHKIDVTNFFYFQVPLLCRVYTYRLDNQVPNGKLS